MPILPEDEQVRGGAYLCQTGPCVSCGSCCGLYNIPALSRERLHAILDERTRAFAAVPRTIESILDFERRCLEAEGTDYPVADFHHCAFVGLIRDDGERVGCLLHPLAAGNGGVDWRGLSFYGGAACKHFFCPTYDWLTPGWKRLIRMILTDWYEYGLIIPEHRFLGSVLEEIEDRLGAPLAGRDPGEEGCLAVGRIVRLKLDWPYRDPREPLAWNFFSTRRTDRPARAYPQGVAPDRLLDIMRELDTLPEHAADAAEELRRLFEQAVSALSRK